MLPVTPTLNPAASDAAAAPSSGLSLAQCCALGAIHYTVDTPQVTDLRSRLSQLAGTCRQTADVTALGAAGIDATFDLLDAGLARAFVTRAQFVELRDKGVPASRLVLSVQSADEADEALLAKSGAGVYLAGGVDAAFAAIDAKKWGHEGAPFYYRLGPQDDASAVAKARSGRYAYSELAPAAELSVDWVAEKIWLDSRSDREDGLISTIVVDERGVALGLVYSSEESLRESIKTGRGVYQSRKRGLWRKGESSGDIQELIRIERDCDNDTFRFVVKQLGKGFCHLGTTTCFGAYTGLSKLEKTLEQRKSTATEGSYTARLFNDPGLLKAKIMEEAEELCQATEKKHIAFEAADLIYFALTKCVSAGVSISDVEKSLDAKSLKVKRRKGDAKGPWAEKMNSAKEAVKEAASVPKSKDDPAGMTADGKIKMTRFVTSQETPEAIQEVLKRPSQRSSDKIMGIVNPIIQSIRERGDAALLEYTHKFEKATSLTSPVLKAPYPQHLMDLPQETIDAIDTSYENIRKFHAAQKEEGSLSVETMPGVICQRFSRPIERVGLYVPGGTAVLPSTALMLGVPAKVAGCKKIVLASPPRADGSVTPEIVYVAHKVGAESIVLAGGAQAVAALAYGTENVTKVDKILGPGNQFVTAAKMIVSNDTSAGVSIDMPAGPSEVLVVADETANPAFVASDLLSQAEHGVDSQVVCIAVNLNETQLAAIEDELHKQAMALPRVDIVRGAIEHSVTLVANDIQEAMRLSNEYAPEHLILQVKDPEKVVDLVENAGSVFVGPWTPESVGDYSAGVNHALRKSYPLFTQLEEKSMLISDSDVRICQAVLGCQSWFLHQAHHCLKSHRPGSPQRWRRSHATCQG
jgi:phosphoribosyl-ATP pyrophosphohydrolase / phosphoribosyl-AMP cyclohydrolase / histidinol dehydrogenase